MRSLITLLLALATFVPGLASAQEAAGRVIAANGAVTIERNLVTVPANVGDPIQSGDVLNVGTGGTAQLRFTDDSIVALGPDSRFQVAEYAYDGVAATAQRVAMSLLKGGLRTVTGQIGKINNSGYKLTTATATIGIRGTGFTVCQDCTTLQGEFLPGTSVAFSEGAGVLTTQAGELPLVAGQSAYARDAALPPVRTTTFPQLRQQASARPSTTTRTASAGSDTGAALSTAVAAGSGDSSTGSASTATGTTASAASAATGDSAAIVVASAPVTTFATSAAPAFQVTSTPVVDTLLAPTAGTAYYRLAGPMNFQVSCSPGPCPTVIEGDLTIGVNYTVKRATAQAVFKLSDGGVFNVAIPIQLSGAPVSIVGNQVTFSGTYNLSDFPQNAGSFACNDCSPSGTPGFVNQLSLSGTISGSQATLSVSLATPDGGSGSFTAPLTQQDPPNNTAAALIVPTLGGGASARSSSYWGAKADASGRLTEFGLELGAVRGSAGGATNTIVGSAPEAGNLVWGRWTNGTTAATKATFTDSQYNTFQPGNNSQQPWITGDASPFLPASLGVLNFNLAGSVLTPNAVLNSATLQADMVNRTLSLNMNVSASPSPSGTNVYQMSGSTGFSPTSNRFSAGFNSVTCSGPCNLGVGTPNGSYGGFFAGPNAEGAGVAFTAGFGPSAGANGVGNGVSGVAGFKR
ncbi:FecR family protein [Ramlibacter algicola]|uniref:FecR domain-containing protein n=1 Tax=Ramlibacter algicola TaxID=2795217 RepID=A0A934Q016_9BURK|nr:FecR family protein [Ramlibacter algicola]MBK0391986.1 FecR domain-containing protein [Ramlibacter algicola]